MRVSLPPPRALGLAALLVTLGAAGCDHPRAAEARALRADCDAGDPQACFEYGQRVFRGDFVLEDRDEAARRWEVACEGGVAGACVRLARLREESEEAAGLPGDIEALLRAGCDGGDMSGCVELAEQFLSGDQASALLERACEGGEAEGCVQLGEILSGVAERGGPIDLKRAAQLFETACGDDAEGCMLLAEARLSGAGVEQSAEEAVSLLRQACRTSPEGCFRLGAMYRDGEGAERDLQRAVTFFQRACYGQTSTSARGDAVAEACYAHGQLLVDGEGIERDLQTATRSIERACRLGHAEACSR